MNRRPSFSVAAFTLVVLALFGLMMDRMRDKIPPAKLNRLRYERSEFLVQASHSAVDWRTYEPETFAEARRTGKPILLLIGLPHGKAARDGDAFVFSDREVASFLNRYLICIRIDALADPRWIGAFLPMRRAKVPMLAGFQLWFLTPEGKLYDDAGEIGTTAPIAPPSVLAALLAARDRLKEIREGGPLAPVPGAEQSADVAALTEPAMPTAVAYREFEGAIAAEARPAWGGFPRFGRIALMPSVFRYLLATGRMSDFQRLANGFAASPAVDWLDGGFYRSITYSLPLVTEFDKATIANAEMMAVLARGWALNRDPLYKRLAEDAFDWLTGEAVRYGLVAGSRIGDEGFRNRSDRQSFTPAEMREALSEDEREFARNHMGLRVETNEVMSVWVREPERTLAMPEFDRVLAKLRAARPGEARFAGTRQLDVHGNVVARLLETAKALNDPVRLQTADELFARVGWFAAGDDVKHTLDTDVPDRPYLGDYLAFVDANLQHFLAFGDTASFDAGLRVLLRARFLFGSSAVGVWRPVLESSDLLEPPDVNAPEVLDFGREACTAQAIRLCQAYGRLLRLRGETDSGQERTAVALCQSAASTVSQFSRLSSEFGLMGASYFCAALTVADDAYAVAVGPDSLNQMRDLYRRVPTRLVGRAVGAVRPDLQKRPAGIYIVFGTQTEGPLSVEQAAQRLSPVLRRR